MQTNAKWIMRIRGTQKWEARDNFPVLFQFIRKLDRWIEMFEYHIHMKQFRAEHIIPAEIINGILLCF